MSKSVRKRRKLRQLLEEMYIWESIGTAMAPTKVDDVLVKQLLVPGAALPWASASGTGQLLHYGRLYHAAKADMARTAEEGLLLQQERARLTRWLAHATQQLRLAIVRHDDDHNAGAAFLCQRLLENVVKQSAEVAAWPAWNAL